MVIRLDNTDIKQAFIDYARKRMGIDMTGLSSIEFRTARNADGYAIVITSNLLHIPSEMNVTTITLNSIESKDKQVRKKTQVIPTAPLPPAPPFLFHKPKGHKI